MKLNTILESKSADLYHATKINFYEDQLKGDYITASVIHRWWKDGSRHDRRNPDGSHNVGSEDDKNPKWKDHVWIKGISLTRDVNFAKKWGGIIFVLDQQKLDARYKFLPMRWSSMHRNESEEFLWMHTSDISGDGPEPIRYAEDGKIKLTNLHKYVKKILVKKDFFKGFTKPKEHYMQPILQYSEKWNIPVEEVK